MNRKLFLLNGLAIQAVVANHASGWGITAMFWWAHRYLPVESPNFDQLGSDECNRKYKELYGTLFNSATLAFYWKKFELEPGKPRFQAEERDSAAYWSASKDPKNETHWRRPAAEPVIAFCESKGIRMHGHPIIWGNRRWHHPEWLFEKFCPADEKAKIQKLGKEGLAKLTPAQIAEQIPVYRSTEGAAESLRAAVAAVNDGTVVTIYPEGTITRDPAAWPMSGRTGAVRVALASGKPLIPVMQWGPQAVLWPYTKRPRLFPRKTIQVRVGKAMDLSAYEGKPLTEELLHAATDELMDTLTAMMSEVRGELPSTPRIDVHSLSKPKTNYKRLDS